MSKKAKIKNKLLRIIFYLSIAGILFLSHYNEYFDFFFKTRNRFDRHVYAVAVGILVLVNVCFWGFIVVVFF